MRYTIHDGHAGLRWHCVGGRGWHEWEQRAWYGEIEETRGYCPLKCNLELETSLDRHGNVSRGGASYKKRECDEPGGWRSRPEDM